MPRKRAGRGNHANTPRESPSPTDSAGIVDSDMFASEEEKDQEIVRLQKREKEHEIVIAHLKDENTFLRAQPRSTGMTATGLSNRRFARPSVAHDEDLKAARAEIEALNVKIEQLQTQATRKRARDDDDGVGEGEVGGVGASTAATDASSSASAVSFGGAVAVAEQADAPPAAAAVQEGAAMTETAAAAAPSAHALREAAVRRVVPYIETVDAADFQHETRGTREVITRGVLKLECVIRKMRQLCDDDEWRAMDGPAMDNLSHRLRRSNFADDVKKLFAGVTRRKWLDTKVASYSGKKVFGPHIHGLGLQQGSNL